MYPKVSVVISTYDRPAMLDKALESVHAQTFKDFEVVVVDDCSPDLEANRTVLEKWYFKLEERGVELIAARLGENSGYQCMPKNKGIEQARGDYIAYLDDDNTWRPRHLEACVAAIESDFSTDMVYTRLCYHADDETRKKYLDQHERELPVGDGPAQPWDPRLISQGNYVDTSTMLHSKGAFWRLVRDSGYGWDESLRRYGDWNLVWRWAVYGNTAKLVDEITVDYNWHPRVFAADEEVYRGSGMLELLTIPVTPKRAEHRVACCIVTRSGREKYLARTLKSLGTEPDILLWANGPMEKPEGVSWFRSHPFNVGQHVAHNEMLDECVRRGYDWHIRVDDDCWINTKTWLRKMLYVQDKLMGLGNYGVLGMDVLGLDVPPPADRAFDLKKNMVIESVDILGGIFRMSPMSIMRYFRWDERQAMGFGDATQFMSFCQSAKVKMFRVRTIHCSHGGSTKTQQLADSDWSYDHDMLQFVPLGL